MGQMGGRRGAGTCGRRLKARAGTMFEGAASAEAVHAGRHEREAVRLKQTTPRTHGRGYELLACVWAGMNARGKRKGGVRTLSLARAVHSPERKGWLR